MDRLEMEEAELTVSISFFQGSIRAMQKQVFVPGWRSSLTSWQRLLLKDQRNLEVRAMTRVCVSYNLCCYSLFICYIYIYIYINIYQYIFTTCYCVIFLISLLVLLTTTIRILYLFIIQRGLRLKPPHSPPSHAERRWWKNILSGPRVQVILVAIHSHPIIQLFKINYTQFWPVFFRQNHHEVSAETLGIE